MVYADDTVGPPTGLPIKETVNLDGFTITGGIATGTGTNEAFGGGIFIDGGQPVIRGCVLTGNFADEVGAGAFCLDTQTAPVFRNCEFIGNHMSHDSVGGGHGAGLATNYSVTVINSRFQDNTCYQGGGLSVEFNLGDFPDRQAVVNVINCQFLRGIAVYGGGAVLIARGTINFTNCLFNANDASVYGAGVWMNVPGSTTFTNCNFVHGTSADVGGGWTVYPNSANVHAYNCIFFDNEPDDVSNNPGAVTMTNCALEQDLSGATSLTDCIIFGQNGAPSDPNFVDNSNTDPLLNDYRLPCDSVCINAGSTNDAATDGQNVDEDSSTTELACDLNFSFRGVGAVDIGCYETPLGAACDPTDIDVLHAPCGDGETDIDDLLLVINSWGACPADVPCYADIMPTLGTVDIDDLLAVINGWGSCEGGSEQMPTDINGCMTEASERYEAFSPDWNAAVNGCVDALCVAEIIECD